LLVFALWELIRPRRPLRASKVNRWITNLGIIGIANGLSYLVATITPIVVAGLAASKGWGLLSLVSMPAAVSVIVGIVALDFTIYLQHVLFHKLPLLWRFHKTHHMDLDLDVTSGLRFHPVEIVISLLIKDAAIIFLGVPVFAVFLFEVILNGTSIFNHGNIYIPPVIDRFLRLIVVTPDMHRVHHSVKGKETDSNFGFNIPWWDRLMGTYTAQPSEGHLGMTIGLNQYREEKQTYLHWMLIMPFLPEPRPQKRDSSKSASK
jgi:sterol desaturase/sphingolipid hydroxylase (fatty acid hydroxylase superfamily)